MSDHSPKWNEFATELILLLKMIFKYQAIKIEYVGSTAIQLIKAKPMIDIAVAVLSFEELDIIFDDLQKNNIFKSTLQILSNTILCAVKKNINSDICLATIHIVLFNSKEWYDLILFKDYLNEFPNIAKEYEELKERNAFLYPNNRQEYSKEKQDFVVKTIEKAKNYYKINYDNLDYIEEIERKKI